MATNRTDSLIASAGGDYSTIQSWEDDIGTGLGSSTNLITDDYDHHGWLAAAQFDEDVVISGHTTDATHRIYLKADHSSRPGGAGTPTDCALMDADRALTYNTSYASMLSNGGYTTGLTLTTEYCVIERLQFRTTSGSKNGVTGGNNARINRCLFDSQRTTGGAYRALNAGGGSTVDACLMVDVGAAYDYALSGSHVRNCTVVRTNGDTAEVASVAYARPAVQNCAFFSGGAGTKAIHSSGGTGWGTLDYNATDHSDLSERSGEGANNVYSLSRGSQFAAVDNTDWRLKAGNDLEGAGTDLTASVALDIFGVAFDAGNPTIGCQHYATGGFQAAWARNANTVIQAVA